MKAELRLKQVETLDQDVAQRVRDIYTASFPPSEQMDFSEIVESVSSGVRLLFVAEQASRAVGFALVFPLSCERVYLLEYLAVDAALRGQGVGGALLGYVARWLDAHRQATGVLLEVERPEDAPGEEARLRQRRIEFYRRNGAHLVEAASSYRMPDLAGSGSLRMALMWLPLGETSGTLRGQRLKEYIVRIYVDAYGRSAEDPILQAILQGLADN